MEDPQVLLPYDPAIQLLGIWPKEMKSVSQRGIYIHMFIAPPFSVAMIWR